MFDCQRANEGARGAQPSGSSLDPQLGPVLLFGTGGALVEVTRQRRDFRPIYGGLIGLIIKTGYFSEIWWAFTIWLFKLHSEAMYNFYRS